jgi:hypothetical protein
MHTILQLTQQETYFLVMRTVFTNHLRTKELHCAGYAGRYLQFFAHVKQHMLFNMRT